MINRCLGPRVWGSLRRLSGSRNWSLYVETCALLIDRVPIGIYPQGNSRIAKFLLVATLGGLWNHQGGYWGIPTICALGCATSPMIFKTNPRVKLSRLFSTATCSTNGEVRNFRICRELFVYRTPC